MWTLLLELVILLLYNFNITYCHLPSYASTPSNKLDQFCVLAESCFHDTIPICGQMGDIKRTFLDICDMLEYACDTNQIYTHVDDTTECPEIKSKGKK